ncbi:hypothetical protein Dsin_025783 [Dipteronia sinensis]|uniref:WAT1-related protein n=1 Tax=Dipteronia sinensis TaxID=43782 RepID=A0AAD9ZY28_9ROSI|nr:hypothetical protein Dsin_025783 [Dipteronia sinensis]
MNWHGQWAPVVLMVVINFALATVNALIKKIMNDGISNLVIVTYRQTISGLFLAPIALFWERNSRPKLTAEILFQLFFSALIGVTLSQYTFLIGLEYTSATFACAFANLVPVCTFLLALPFGLEKVNMKSFSGRAKVLGALICIGGALLLSLYQGNPLTKPHVADTEQITTIQSTKPKKWAIGSIILILAFTFWSSWFLMQARIGKRYPCQYSSTAMLSIFGAIQSAILCLIIDRKLSGWVLKGKLDITTVIYSGMVGSGLCYVGMSWCVKQRGPVFTSSFTPLVQIFVAMFDFSLLHEPIFLGSVLGSVLVVSGMYILLLGKSKEIDEAKMKQAQVVALQGQDDEEHCNGVSHVIPITSNSTTIP